MLQSVECHVALPSIVLVSPHAESISTFVDERPVCQVLCQQSVRLTTLVSLVDRPKHAGRTSADAVCPLGAAQAAD